MNILEQNMRTISEQNMVGKPPKFSQYDADKIISDILNYKYDSFYEIAKEYKCHHITVRNLLNRRHSRQLTQHYSEKELERCKWILSQQLTKHDVDKIISDILNYKYDTYYEISENYKFTEGTVRKLLKRISSRQLTQHYSEEELEKCRAILRQQLTKHDVDKIISDILNYKYDTFYEIAKKYKCSHMTVRKLLNRTENKDLTQDYSDEELERCKWILNSKIMGRLSPKFSQYDADKIISDTLNYKYDSFYEIAKKYKCSHRTVRNLLNRIYSRQLTQHYSDEELERCRLILSGKTIRGGTTKFSQYDVDKIISDTLNYKYDSYDEIAKEYKCTHETVRNMLTRNHLKQFTRYYSKEELEKCRAILSKQLSKYTIDYIKNELEKGTKPKNISKVTGVSIRKIAQFKFRMKHKVKDDIV